MYTFCTTQNPLPDPHDMAFQLAIGAKTENNTPDRVKFFGVVHSDIKSCAHFCLVRYFKSRPHMVGV